MYKRYHVRQTDLRGMGRDIPLVLALLNGVFTPRGKQYGYRKPITSVYHGVAENFGPVVTVCEKYPNQFFVQQYFLFY